MFFNTPSCLNSRPCAGRNLFKRIVSRFLVRRSAKFLLPSINPHVLSISQFSDQNCESILSSKRTGGSNKSAMFDPLLVRQGYFDIFPTASTCTSIFSRNHIPTSLHQYHLCQQARAPCHWVLAFTHEEPNCVRKWGEPLLDLYKNVKFLF